MSVDRKAAIRCAIYTRKSSEEGLEQPFNSLDAQREACQAFIVSQRLEGWRALPIRYDDGGYSGGSLGRPALKRLLEDVEANKIDTVVVYKVDRLTRSLSDFAKIIEAFDAHEVSFVSVTQQFNTTTSMGRLTLNVLLSFAQFEREVTGERIRDKIAASKRKGMWMGGRVPLGYDLNERKLAVNPEEAKLVRNLYQLYLELGCVSRLKQQLDRRNVKSKLWVSRSGIRSGGASFSRGALYELLQNRIYLGEIGHRDQWYPGEHGAIIPQELWDKVQSHLRDSNQGRRNGLNARSPSLLASLLYDSKGNRFTPSHAVKNGKRYRYYVCRYEQRSNGNDQQRRPNSLPAYDIEKQVTSKLQSFLRHPKAILDELGLPDDAPAISQRLMLEAKHLSARLASAQPSYISELVRGVVRRVMVGDEQIDLLVSKTDLRRAVLCDPIVGVSLSKEKPQEDLFQLVIQARLRRCGGEARLVLAPGLSNETPTRQAPSLVRATVRAHDWYERLIAGEIHNLRSLARQTGLNERYVSRVLRCAFLAPDIIEAILDGRQPPELTLERLQKKLPVDWVEQRMRLGFPSK